MKIGVFGGTFNPIHYGHLRAAEEVRERLSFEKILFVPSVTPPLKAKGIADAGHRFGMVRIAIADNPLFELSDIEYGIPGKSYTVKTVRALQEKYPGAGLFLILGTDAFLDLPNWWRPDELVSLTDFIIISRPGLEMRLLAVSPYLKVSRQVFENNVNREGRSFRIRTTGGRQAIILGIPPFQISSTEIRRLVKAGKSIKYLLPPKVQSYIISNKLYK